jgi:NAD+ kinase
VGLPATFHPESTPPVQSPAMDAARLSRLGLVVHPRREISTTLDALRSWSKERGIDVVQVPTAGQEREVAPPGRAEDCDAIVALGGDGTTLAALHAAAPAGRPVLGVACGSLGALTAVTGENLLHALDRLAAGDWHPRKLAALDVESPGEELRHGLNDVVLVRAGAGQVSAEIRVDGALFIRFAGDGIVVATPLGSSAYTLAAGGPMLAEGARGMVVTPVAPHGGCCPSLVAGPGSRVDIALDPGNGGARIEFDGQVRDRVEPRSPRTFEVSLRPEHATLIALGDEEPMLAGLRRRQVIIDSPRLLARDAREAAARS